MRLPRRKNSCGSSWKVSDTTHFIICILTTKFPFAWIRDRVSFLNNSFWKLETTGNTVMGMWHICEQDLFWFESVVKLSFTSLSLGISKRLHNIFTDLLLYFKEIIPGEESGFYRIEILNQKLQATRYHINKHRMAQSTHSARDVPWIWIPERVQKLRRLDLWSRWPTQTGSQS